MKYRSTLLLLLFLLSLVSFIPKNIPIINLPEIVVKADSKIHFNPDNINLYLPEYVLVGIVNHECFKNAEITEKIFIMEAAWNRVVYNFNGNGITLADQLLAKNQFTGLFKYRPKEFVINFNSSDNQYLIKLAREIIYEHKRIYPIKIYYWAGICDSDGAHGKWVKRKQMKTLIKTKNIFA